MKTTTKETTFNIDAEFPFVYTGKGEPKPNKWYSATLLEECVLIEDEQITKEDHKLKRKI